jgi:hypothetical protein
MIVSDLTTILLYNKKMSVVGIFFNKLLEYGRNEFKASKNKAS